MQTPESLRTRHQYRHLPAAILLELAQHPLHGRAIHAALCELLPDFRPDTGAVYRTLQRLEREGEIEFTWETGHAGPARKIYSLTSRGWEKLAVWREDIEKRLRLLHRFLATYEGLALPKPRAGRGADWRT